MCSEDDRELSEWVSSDRVCAKLCPVTHVHESRCGEGDMDQITLWSYYLSFRAKLILSRHPLCNEILVKGVHDQTPFGDLGRTLNDGGGLSRRTFCFKPPSSFPNSSRQRPQLASLYPNTISSLLYNPSILKKETRETPSGAIHGRKGSHGQYPQLKLGIYFPHFDKCLCGIEIRSLPSYGKPSAAITTGDIL
jgi:hypothetical protein